MKRWYIPLLPSLPTSYVSSSLRSVPHTSVWHLSLFVPNKRDPMRASSKRQGREEPKAPCLQKGILGGISDTMVSKEPTYEGKAKLQSRFIQAPSMHSAPNPNRSLCCLTIEHQSARAILMPLQSAKLRCVRLKAKLAIRAYAEVKSIVEREKAIEDRRCSSAAVFRDASYACGKAKWCKYLQRSEVHAGGNTKVVMRRLRKKGIIGVTRARVVAGVIEVLLSASS